MDESIYEIPSVTECSSSDTTSDESLERPSVMMEEDTELGLFLMDALVDFDPSHDDAIMSLWV